MGEYGLNLCLPAHGPVPGSTERSTIKHGNAIKVYYLPTDAQEDYFKKNIKIYIKTAPTCFGAITITRERIIWAC